MSMRGTPWYDMALDAGAAKGEEAELMARHFEEEAQIYEERCRYEAWVDEQRALDELYRDRDKGIAAALDEAASPRDT